MVIMVITGGKGTLAGPIVGGLIFGFLPVIVRAFAAPAVQWILYGGLMILIVFVLPQGIVPAVERLDRELDAAHASRRRTIRPSAERAPDDDAASATREPVLSIEHVAVHFGGLVAIADLNFTVREGEIVGLIGPNGAGKTTAFNVFTGFLRPTKGEVRYRGTSLNGLKPHEIAEPRPGADVPAHQHLSEQQRVRERADRPAPPRPATRVGYAAGPAARERSPKRELRDRGQRNPAASSASSGAPASSPAPCPTASSACSASRSRSPRKPSMLLLDEPVSGMNASETANFMTARRDHPRSRRDHPAGRARHADGHGGVGPHRRAQLRAH